jgi:hypothetical protein
MSGVLSAMMTPQPGAPALHDLHEDLGISVNVARHLKETGA